MKVLVILTVAVIAVSAKPSALLPVVQTQYHAQDELGQYSYGYSSGLSSKAEARSIDGVTRGGYSYVDAEGKLQTVQYTSDPVHGFRVAATNLPVAPALPAVPALSAPAPVVDTPEVAEAKAKHLAALKAAEERTVAAVAPAAVAVAPAGVTSYAALPAPVVQAYQFAAPLTVSYASFGVPSAVTTYSYSTPVLAGFAAPALPAASVPAVEVKNAEPAKEEAKSS